jgi:hypothetical protein
MAIYTHRQHNRTLFQPTNSINNINHPTLHINTSNPNLSHSHNSIINTKRPTSLSSSKQQSAQ